MEFSTLNTGLKVFLSRNVTGAQGEDLVEKQSAEQGLMPILEDEAATYGYTLEDRHMVGAFREGEAPLETFRDGVAVVEMLMALYRSAETGSTVPARRRTRNLRPAGCSRGVSWLTGSRARSRPYPTLPRGRMPPCRKPTCR